MTANFLGTRGNLPIHSPRHRRHSTLLLSGPQGRLLIDCGEDWVGRVAGLRPTAILVTHGHPDHAGALRRGAPCPVYAMPETWRIMARWPLPVRCELPIRHAVIIAGFVVEAWPVQHSLNAPAVGFKVFVHGACLFYAPDVARLPQGALDHVDVYVGDGAVLTRSLVRHRGSVLIGHASVTEQLDWCRAYGVSRAFFTHCGSGIVRSDPTRIEAIVRSLGRRRGVTGLLAHDGLTIRVRAEHAHK